MDKPASASEINHLPLHLRRIVEEKGAPVTIFYDSKNGFQPTVSGIEEATKDNVVNTLPNISRSQHTGNDFGLPIM